MNFNVYDDLISQATGVNDSLDIARIEDFMRDSVFCSTLDWQTKKQLKDGAKKAVNAIRLGAEIGYWDSLRSDPKPEYVLNKFQVTDDSEINIHSFFLTVKAKDTSIKSHLKGFIGCGNSFFPSSELKAISTNTQVTLESVEKVLEVKPLDI